MGNRLTKEEKDVVILAALHPFGQYLSLSNTEIGERLNMSTARVKTLLHQACVKLKAKNRIEVVIFALMRREVRLNDIYSLDEIAEIFRVMSPEMSSMVLSIMREDMDYFNFLEKDERTTNIDIGDRKQSIILTNSERDVLHLAGRGLTNREIAERLFFSEGSVRTFLYRACTKLGARNRAEAVVLALERRETSIEHTFSINELLHIIKSGVESLEKITRLLGQQREPVPTGS